MTRLQAELDRLYRHEASSNGRALVLEVVQPVGWDALSLAWQGVQADLELPAPAIAVSGVDAIQLWFSVEAPVDAAQAHAFLDGLRARFLADVPPARVRTWPANALARVPALQATGNWSAFVSPDLITVFSDTPWLDIEPGDEGQATLLRPLRSIAPKAFADAIARLREHAQDAPAPAPTREEPKDAGDDPRAFLLRVMNDERVDMALRIEAAKALLPGWTPPTCR